ncbi:MAG: cytochrome c nitrite reductase small subunit [Candidatus Rokuibacteriota bacterium]|nr:MAG: cytochrome c nitrite reductase small subunit [Candidatus Rokubacteria bacterium]
MSRLGLLLVFACLVGIPAGLGGFTFVYARGLSYLSTDPRACVNCHVMNEQYDAWLKSGHRHTATCVECHLPAHGLAKWVAKADHGFRHSMAFTLQNFKEPIEITARDRRVVQRNCVRCHEGLVAAVHTSPGPIRHELDCMHCHAGAGHGAGG